VERRRNGFVIRGVSREQESENETDCIFCHDDGVPCGLRDDTATARDANVPRRLAGSRGAAVPAAAAAASDGLPQWNHGPGRHGVSGAAAAATAATTASAASGPRRRTRLIFHAPNARRRGLIR